MPVFDPPCWLRFAPIVMLFLATRAAGADEAPPPSKPLWELGIGMGVAAFPHYPGSDQTRAWVFPFPYIVYRGKFFRADRDGVRGQLIDTDRVNLNISVLGSLPVSSRDDNARAGMPDLKPTIEIGPSVEVHFWRSPSRDMLLDLRMPLRLGITLESSPKTVGWQFEPNLNLDLVDVAGVPGLRVGMFAGPMFADRKYSDHYYTVAPPYATPGRPAFDASGGYAGAGARVDVAALQPLLGRCVRALCQSRGRAFRRQPARASEERALRRRGGGVGVRAIVENGGER
ncbi:MltA-interacting protein MipA [Caballeronia ptereochthonis]|uniref:MltA-interacting protein MipA n=1 Tax=Caballeronia ptereochthonis TaxID=1777144 RepID=A0A158C8F3_9BURK|nr:MltA-interacting protein MipA [Caballeronia ptereochthonis]